MDKHALPPRQKLFCFVLAELAMLAQVPALGREAVAELAMLAPVLALERQMDDTLLGLLRYSS
jgi:predicted ATP-dependent protease